MFEAIRAEAPAVEYHEVARAVTLKNGDVTPGHGTVLIAAAGTSDLPVAEEAVVTAEVMGNRVDRLFDVGWRSASSLARAQRLAAARVIVVVAGMEGALSVVAGLVSVPVITIGGIGYGTSFESGRAAGDAEQLRQRRVGCEHRQRLRSRVHCESDKSSWSIGPWSMVHRSVPHGLWTQGLMDS
jgi:hypothetical protein